MSEAAAPRGGAAARSWRPWALGAVVALFLVTRLWNLMGLPVFLDEAMHLDWASRIAATGQLVGITDGGRYLPIWGYAVVAAGATDPLRAARLCSVASGLAATLGLVWLGRLLDSEWTGIVAAFLYVAFPFTLFYDRMALVDSLLSALVVYTLVFAVLWGRTALFRWAITLALALAAAGLTKLSGMLLLPVPALVVLSSRTNRRGPLRAQLPWVYALGLVLLLPVFLDLAGTGRFFQENLWVLRSGPDGSSFIFRNAQLAVAWLGAYLTPAGAVLVCLAIAKSLKDLEPPDALLLSVAAAWCLFFVLAGGRYWFPRYLLPAIPPLLLLVARRAVRAGAPVAWLVAGLFALAWFRFDAALIADPVSAPLPPVERSQYIYDWPSGFGLSGAASLLLQEAAAQPVVVLRDASSCPLKEGLDLFLRRQAAGIEAVDVPVKTGDFSDAIERLILARRPVFFVIDQAVDRQLVLSLDGQRALAPRAAFLKPGIRRQVAVYAVAGGGGDPKPHAIPAVPPRRSRWGRLWPAGEASGCAAESGEASLESCRQALAGGLEGPAAAEAHYHLGRTLLLLGRGAEAVAALREAARLFPDDPKPQLALAEALESCHRYEEALRALEEAARLQPASASLHDRIGWDLGLLGRWGEAEAAFRRSVALDGSAAAAHNGLGVCLWRRGRREEALGSLAEAVRLDPAELRAGFNLNVARNAVRRGR